MQRTVLHSLARAAVGIAIVCGATVSNGVLADTVFKDTDARIDARADVTDAHPEGKRGLLSSMMNSTSNVATKAGDLVMNALGLIGVRYRFGGNSPESGLDCSGFVRYVFNDTFGFMLPRRSVEMSQVGATVAANDLRPGDLVFFNTMRHTFSHVGIYIGDNKFVHAPSTGSKIRVDDMRAAYWVTRYNGARRIDDSARGSVENTSNMIETLKRYDPNAQGRSLYGG
ncbi:cell wall-associated NlpC family hydrolase [Cupriavidus metallidurans]|jgi:cell wall-associated NlpC family hydrolase|uniref:NLP/P60 n=2 Tax=Cupriavidus metallidurans TaxID=119219 RepID=Q1LLF5_CUPMC|nr:MULTISPECIES: C40 family peptidase [Cupriavidus]MBL4600079.1 C40 family peptidase [Rhizobiaceae bacterium]HBD36357.1 peptidoglycan endopeptidase [Cupriavidus sp.]ABF09021.1 NLP/P60 precursor [Cupriavidus metallidurans CH34]AVA36231.1 peptidoglycan endopeptidase [Cupriavidus metallidurans]ELA01083.1 NLP/P60 protein [Cupriavidus sp. HMR-1]